MNVLILNGSPRKNGNTSHALNAIAAGLQKHHAVQSVNVYDLMFRPCRNCDACKRNGGNCIQVDDTVKIMNAVAGADFILFGSPVYWWGISAQLKDVLDKFYSKDDSFKTVQKRLGIVACGAETIDDPEYRLISEQFQYIAAFLGWKLVIDESICAAGVDDLAKDTARLAQLEAIGASL